MTSRVLGIVADDLTGSIDTGGGFAAKGLRTVLSVSPLPQTDVAPPEVLCYNTQTRNLDASEAVKPVRQAAQLLIRQGYPRLYKKIDSTLRGHVGLELSTMLDESGAPNAFVAPAFPDMGRTQRDGLLYVGDLPLAHVQEGNDPFGKLTSPSVVELLRQQTGLRVGLVGLSSVEIGETDIEKQVRALSEQGCTVVAFDALCNEHLARIEAVLARTYPNGLLVGSAGLASAMAARIGRKGHDLRRTREPKAADGPLVLVSGSLNRTTLAQLQHLETARPVYTVHLDASSILGSDGRRYAEGQRALREARAALDHGEDICLRWRRTQLGEAEVVPQDEFVKRSRVLNTFLKGLVGNILDGAHYAGLVLVGGDTAHSVLTGLRAEGVRLDTEILPGISMGTIVGGDADSKTVVAKAGGFGAEDALVRVVEYLRACDPFAPAH